MLRRIIFAAITCLSWAMLNAQSNSVSKIRAGFKTGLSFSSFTKDVGVFDKNNPSGQNNYAGYNEYFRIASLAGVVVKYKASPQLSWGVELAIIGRGASYRRENGSVTIITDQGAERAYDYYKFKLNYLELPFTANYNVSARSKGRTAFSVYAGLAPAVAVGRKTSFHSYTTNGGSPVADDTVEEAELSSARVFNLSTVAGFEIGGTEKGNVFVNARISNSLLPVFKESTSPDGANMKTGMWSLILGIGFYFR